MTEENGATAPQTEYTLQVWTEEHGAGLWRDEISVTVPARTKRETAIKGAAREAGLDLSKERKVRLLDAESAEVRTVRPKPPAAPEIEVA